MPKLNCKRAHHTSAELYRSGLMRDITGRHASSKMTRHRHSLVTRDRPSGQKRMPFFQKPRRRPINEKRKPKAHKHCVVCFGTEAAANLIPTHLINDVGIAATKRNTTAAAWLTTFNRRCSRTCLLFDDHQKPLEILHYLFCTGLGKQWRLS